MDVGRSLGAEEELHVIDSRSGRLSARAPRLLTRLPPGRYSAELQRTTIEINTDVVEDLAGLRQQLLGLRRHLVEIAEREGLGVAAVGTAPHSVFEDFELSTGGRYHRMQEQYRLLVDEQLICGLQVHVGVPDRDLAVQIAQRVSSVLPVLLALSASSPYWNGQDTGYASIRSVLWQRWPTAGPTGALASAAEYDRLVDDLIASGVIADARMAYFDVRPSDHAPTLELRVCDACPVVDDAVLIAGLFRAAVRAAAQDVAAGRPYVPLPQPLRRAAMWQAARTGLAGDLLDDGERPRPVPAEHAVRRLVERLRPQLAELGDDEEVRELAEAVLVRGSSADRQRAAFAEQGRIDDVVRLVVRETHGSATDAPPGPTPWASYHSRAGDEAIGLGRRPRPVYGPVVDFYRDIDPAALAERHRTRDEWSRRHGLSFGVDGAERGFVVDLIPRIVRAHEWARLKPGIAQRARAVEAFLQDVYTDRRVIADGVLPAERVVGASGWNPEALRLPRGTVRAPIMGFDLVRDQFGHWRVLEDNVRTPSGAAFALAARELLDAAVPDLPRPAGLADPSSVLPALRETLLAHAAPGTAGALLSEGPGNPAWYEHRRLAEGAGLLLVQAHDVHVAGGRLRHRGTGAVIGALYLRLDMLLADLRDEHGRALGRAILDLAAGSRIVLANTPGTGIADDKAMYCYVPDLIGYYLGERPLLDSVPTYRTGDATERRSVLERVGELVTKPVDGYGGHGVLIGPAATAAEVSHRRVEIAEDPAGWVAQEPVALSLHPTFAGTAPEPRHVDLRVFACLTGTAPHECRVPDLGLTRVGAAGSLIVNSSRGGGAKDTWILGEPPGAGGGP